jgi:hypothetical protein
MNKKIKPIESISISTVHFTLNLPQASRLLGMTIILQGNGLKNGRQMDVNGPTELSSQPERTRISCCAALANARVCGFL